jgi:hypothetical protein
VPIFIDRGSPLAALRRHPETKVMVGALRRNAQLIALTIDHAYVSARPLPRTSPERAPGRIMYHVVFGP